MDHLPLTLAGVLLLLSGGANAQAAFTSLRSEFGANTSMIEGAKVNANAVISNASGSAKAVGRVDFLGPGGRAASAQLEATISKRSALAIAGRMLAAATGVGTAALLAYEVYDAIRVRPMPAGGDELLFDPGQDTETGLRWTSYAFNMIGGGGSTTALVGATITGTNSTELAHDLFEKVSGSGRAISAIACGPVVGGGSCSATVCTPASGCSGFSVGLNVPVSATVCPVDVSTGMRPAIGHDGKCPTGSYTQAVTPDEAAQMRDASALPTPDLAALMDEVLGRGPVALPADTPAVIQAGTIEPATIPGPVKVTTEGENTTTEETSYAPATPLTTSKFGAIKQPWWMTKTTTTVDGEGDPVGEPKTETTMPPEPGAEGETSGDEADPCVGHPDRAGCKDLGEPEDVAPEWEESIVPWTVESLGLPSGCPVPYSFTVRGIVMALDYQVLCDVAPVIRAGMLILAWLSATFFVIGAVRT